MMRCAGLLAALFIASLARAERHGDTAARVEKGVQFLLRCQKDNGAWVSEEYGFTSPGHKVAITAACAHALLASSTSPEALRAVKKAIAHLESCVAELDSDVVNDGFNFRQWGPAYGLLHVAGALERWPKGEAKPDARKLVDAWIALVEKWQKPCGGWNYVATAKDGSMPFLSAVMIDGLLRWPDATKGKAGVVERAITDLKSSADKAGWYGYSHDGKYEGVSGRPWWSPIEAAGRSVQAALVLVEAGKAKPESLLPYLEHLFQVRPEYVKVRNQHPHTDPHKIAGYYYYHSVYYAARAIRKLGSDPKAWAQSLQDALFQEQESDGSWIDAPCGGKPYATALALLSLADVERFLLPWTDTLDTAITRAKEAKKPVLYFFTDGKKESSDVEETLLSPALAETMKAFVAFRTEIAKDDPSCKKASVLAGPVILVLDPSEESPLGKPLKKIRGNRAAKALEGDLKKALADYVKLPVK